MALTLLFFALAERYPGTAPAVPDLMYVSVGLGVLTKGPVAALCRRWSSRSTSRFIANCDARLRMSIPLGIAIVLAIVVPWYTALYQRYGGPTSPRSSSARTSIATPAASGSSRIAACCSTPRSCSAIRFRCRCISFRRPSCGSSTARASESMRIRVRTLLWLWIAVIVGFFSLSAAKQDLYIFPIVPAMAALWGSRSPGRSTSVRTVAAVWTAVCLGLDCRRRQLRRDRYRARLSGAHGRRSLCARRRDVDWRRRDHRRAGHGPVRCARRRWPRRSSRCSP